MSKWTTETQFAAHSKGLINVYWMNKINVVVHYLAGIVESIGMDGLTKGENRERRKREPLGTTNFRLKLSDRN